MTYTNATPVLRVSDYARAKAFYMDVLGFEVTQEAGDPVTGFGIFRAGSAQIFLMAWDGPDAAYDGWRVYLYPQDLDAQLAHIAATGTAVSGPTVTEYGMREVQVTDPDGNVICLGEDAA
ncbi:VOC family protein [Tateyamaria omphalii]|uniref:glyoxalase superfamily protein n=1 Tax=Tateyamaria omphalii TaxID=299262 RepID=UPI001C9913AB|nr:glyoxalase superfamily protein [Tateyamaria omphalii]MBY5933045.1 VOC family protein [Tateyamaria omphalii]